jgi:hypothetical protein
MWEGGRNFGAEKEVEKNLIISNKEDVFLVHPQNSLNGLIFNWCIGGCWSTPTGLSIVPNRIAPNLGQGQTRQSKFLRILPCFQDL